MCELVLGRRGEGPDLTDLRVRFAQVSAALRERAVTNIAAWRYTPLLFAAEVGVDPGDPAPGPAAFHAFCARTQRDWPLTGTVPTSDATRRSADTRAALAALTEHPEGFAAVVRRATEHTARLGVRAPDPHLAWTAWQTASALGSPNPQRLLAAVRTAARGAVCTPGGRSLTRRTRRPWNGSCSPAPAARRGRR